jgi:hypothetical protein
LSIYFAYANIFSKPDAFHNHFYSFQNLHDYTSKIRSRLYLLQIFTPVDMHQLCTGLCTLATHIFELEGNADACIFAQLDHILQIVDLLAGYPYHVVHDLGLHF